MKSLRIVSSAVLLTAGYLGAQSSADTLSRLRALQLKEVPGPVPLIYSPASAQRALRWQRSLAAAQAWFQTQLHLQAPVTLAVLDRETWKRVSTEAMPHAIVKSALIVFPEHIEDIYPDAPKSLDPVLAAEAVISHEAGHILADALKFDGNTFVSEFVANVFMAGYIRAARPDLTFMLNGPVPGMKTPRYTSGGDLNYLEANVPPENYLWFELQLQRLADYCLKGRDFAAVVEKLAVAFPAVHPRHVNIVEASNRLEALFPGFKTAAGAIAGPPTLTRIKPATCNDSPKSDAPVGEWRLVVIRNDTAGRLDLTKSDGSITQVDAYAWRRYAVPAGKALQMSDGRCLAAGEAGDPVLAIIE